MFVDRNGDGKINSADKYIYKKPAADVLMGLTSKMLYKDWDFSFSLRASLNNYVYYDFLSNKANVSASGLYTNNAYVNTTKEAIALGFTGKGEYYMSDYLFVTLHSSVVTISHWDILSKLTPVTGLSRSGRPCICYRTEPVRYL